MSSFVAFLKEGYNFVSYEKERINIETAFQAFLQSINKSEYFEHINYILKEIITNAEKANLKRLYFENNGWDINNFEQYRKAINNFRETILNNYEYYIDLAKRKNLKISLQADVLENNIVINISNSAAIIPVEIERIKERFRLAQKFNSIEEVFSSVLDQTEGAGFGLILTILIMRKLGLDEKAIQLKAENSKTTFVIKIPMDLISKSKGEIIANEVVKEVEAIPQFPHHIIEVINSLNNPNSNFQVVGQISSKDPAFAGELLKIANSPIYSLPKKVENINDAIRILGLTGVKNFVLTYSAKKILANKYNLQDIKKIMDHSTNVTFLAIELAKALNKKQIIDNLFIGAMLHDLGKIILKGMKTELVDKIHKVCVEKGINNFMVESLTNGYNHSIIGGKLAEKWNLPEFIVQTIMYHHIPLEAENKYFDIVSLVYLADFLYYYNLNETKYDDLNFTVLRKLGLEEKTKFENIVTPILNKYSKIFTNS